MNIMTNLTGLAASRQLNINSSNFQKTTKKLASGYKINIAADGAAELGISEQMRSQIRGLNKSVTNAEEGANFIQTGDGTMNEIHSMLQRMRELSVQSLNDTNTQADRAALAQEFNELQSEIDRIGRGTYFNTQPVFEEHEASFYQIAGNRKWPADQLHTITEPKNDFIVNLPSDPAYGYDPAQYAIHVPSGTYTTQELIDEIEDAFAALKDPANPSFVLEFDDEGYCNLNFESAEGDITKIQSVDGTLAYLIYDCFTGSSSADLLGTTTVSDRLPIINGKNDTLQFYLEGGSDLITIKIPGSAEGKEYTRQELIDEINRQLRADPLTKDLDLNAMVYDGTHIQIKGSGAVGITGLKGNMFTIEHTAPIYTSVFYDNVSPGVSTAQAAYIQGEAYCNAGTTELLKITSGRNDKLAFELTTPDTGKVEYTFTLPEGAYTMEGMVRELNKLFADSPLGLDTYLTAKESPMGYLRLETKQAANGYALSFLTDASKDPAAAAAYHTLFTTTIYQGAGTPFVYSGADSSPAALTGRPVLTAPITISSAQNQRCLTIKAGSAQSSIYIDPGTYPTLDALVSHLNSKVSADPDLKGKITFALTSGSRLAITGTGSSSISITNPGTDVYDKLFEGMGTIANPEYKTAKGEQSYVQGDPGKDIIKMASITMGGSIASMPVTIDNSSCALTFYLKSPPDTAEYSRTVYLTKRDYASAEDLVNELNTQLKKVNIHAEASITTDAAGKHLTLSTTPTRYDGTPSISVNVNASSAAGGSAWKVFLGSKELPLGPESTPYSSGSKTYIEGVNRFDYYEVPQPIDINNTNNTFTISLNGVNTPIPVTIPVKQYSTAAELRDAIRTALQGSAALKGKIDVSVTSAGCLKFTAAQNGLYSFTINEESNFYKEILGEKNQTRRESAYGQNGSHKFPANGSYIIGRADLKGKEIEIIGGINDTFEADLTYAPAPPSTIKNNLSLTLSAVLPPGVHSSDDIASFLQEKFQEQLTAQCEKWVKELKDQGLDIDSLGLNFNLGLDVGIGQPVHTGNVSGVDETKVLQIRIKELNGSGDAAAGTYTIDGIRGKAAYSIFYKTTEKQEFSYAVGSKDLSGGIAFGPGKNEFSFMLDDELCTYRFPENAAYTAEDFIKILNEKFAAGDGHTGTPPVNLEASLQNGYLKLTYQAFGAHTIRDVSGSAKGLIFYSEDERDDTDPFMLQVGALGHQGLEINRFRVNTASLGINSVTISQAKYAEKALARLDRAIDLLSSRRSTYGALQNRIDFLKSNNKNASQNIQASESRIRDANMAAEMVEHVKNQLITQASEAVLAQANQLPNRILNLLT